MSRYRTIAVSCKAKELLEEIVKITAANRGAYVEKLLEKELKKLKEEETKR